jgi:thioredoxin-related protein
LPSLENLSQHFRGKPFVLLGIDIKERRETVLRYVRSNGLSYPNLLDEDGRVSAEYGVSSTPMKFLIDTEGNLIGAALGYRDWDNENAKKLIEFLINSKK